MKNEEYPWLNKPIEEWSWEDIKADVRRCGHTELLFYVLEDGLSEEEKERRFRVLHRWDSSDICWIDLWEHCPELFLYKPDFLK